MAFLGGMAALISSFVDTDKPSNNSDTNRKANSQNITPNNRHDYFSEPIQQKSTRGRNSGRKIDLYKTIEDKLYLDAFTPMKALLPVIFVFSLITIGTLIVAIISGADDTSLSFIGLIWLASVSGIYIIMIKTLYRRINIKVDPIVKTENQQK